MNVNSKGIQMKEEVKWANIFPLLLSTGKIVDTLNSLSSQKGKRKSLRPRFRRKKIPLSCWDGIGTVIRPATTTKRTFVFKM